MSTRASSLVLCQHSGRVYEAVNLFTVMSYLVLYWIMWKKT